MIFDGLGFSLYPLIATFTGHFCHIVTSTSSPEASVRTATTLSILYCPASATDFTVNSPLKENGTMIL